MFYDTLNVEPNFLIANHFVHLEMVGIVKPTLSGEFIAKMLRSNPQLNNVEITTNRLHSISSNFSNALETLRKLDNFRFHVEGRIPAKAIRNAIALKNVGCFELDGSDVFLLHFDISSSSYV